MSNQIVVPSLGESVTEATVAKWLKQVGEEVNSDEPLVELETDKVNVEVPSPLSGTLSDIKVKEGDTVEVGALLGIISEGPTSDLKKTVKKQEEQKNETSEKLETSENLEENTLKLVNTVEIENKNSNNDPLILSNLAKKSEKNIEPKQTYIDHKQSEELSPAVRKIVQENNIDVSNIEGTGKDGRISKGDLINLMGGTPKPSSRKISHGPEERVKMTRLRSTIAKRLKEAQNNAAMLTTFNEVNMENIIKIRQNYQDDFQKKYSTKLGFMSFFVKSTVVALKNFPKLNAEVDGEEIVYKNYYNIGVAVGTDRGLVVPVLRNSDELSFADIEKNIFLLSQKARDGKIVIDDLQGGTFTISNGGIYGSMLSTPILNPPQSGVLGMHNIIERPIVTAGEIVIRPIMYLALSYDHRIVDGKEAVSFLKTIKECLEEPRRLFLDL